MAKAQPVGMMACPECGFPDAEVKHAKSGLLYRWCPDCSAQFFARDPEASKRLGEKIRPVSVMEPEPEPGGAPSLVPEPKKTASRGFDLGAL